MLTFFLLKTIKIENTTFMFDLFNLKPGLPPKSTLQVTYYFLLIISIAFGVLMILEGLNDPFGEFLILIGVLVLLIIPVSLRVIFGLLLKQ